MANNKQRQNFFDQQIRQNGEGFLMYMSPDNIQKTAKRKIFREMATGAIDYSEYGKYFQESKFFENLLIAANDELQNNSIIYAAIDLLDRTCPGNNQVIILKGKYRSLVYVYQTIYNSLYRMKFENYNVGCLADLAPLLYQFKNQI